MIYYSGLLFYILITYFLTKSIKNKKAGKKIFFILVCLSVILFQGFRSFTVGIDLTSYIPSYLIIGQTGFSDLTFLNYEPGYVLLNKVLFALGLSQRGFLIVVSMIIQIPIFFTIYQNSEEPLISVLWYFAFGNFLMTFSGLRQAIAMSICFGAYYFIKNKKVLWFLTVIVIASFIHKSALFCLMLYPLYYIKIDKKKILFVLLMLLVIFVFKNRIFSIASKFYYGESKMTTETGAYTMFAVYLLLYCISFIKNKIDSDYIGLRNILLMLVIIYMFASMHNFVARIGFPLTLYMSLFIPKLVNSIKVKPRFLYIGVISTCLILCFYYSLGSLNTLPFSFG